METRQTRPLTDVPLPQDDEHVDQSFHSLNEESVEQFPPFIQQFDGNFLLFLCLESPQKAKENHISQHVCFKSEELVIVPKTFFRGKRH